VHTLFLDGSSCGGGFLVIFLLVLILILIADISSGGLGILFLRDLRGLLRKFWTCVSSLSSAPPYFSQVLGSRELTIIPLFLTLVVPFFLLTLINCRLLDAPSLRSSGSSGLLLFFLGDGGFRGSFLVSVRTGVSKREVGQEEGEERAQTRPRSRSRRWARPQAHPRCRGLRACVWTFLLVFLFGGKIVLAGLGGIGEQEVEAMFGGEEFGGREGGGYEEGWGYTGRALPRALSSTQEVAKR